MFPSKLPEPVFLTTVLNGLIYSLTRSLELIEFHVTGHVLNSYGDLLTYPNQKLHQPNRVDQVIYPSSSETMLNNDRCETGVMLSLALKIHVDARSELKVFQIISDSDVEKVAKIL